VAGGRGWGGCRVMILVVLIPAGEALPQWEHCSHTVHLAPHPLIVLPTLFEILFLYFLPFSHLLFTRHSLFPLLFNISHFNYPFYLTCLPVFPPFFTLTSSSHLLAPTSQLFFTLPNLFPHPLYASSFFRPLFYFLPSSHLLFILPTCISSPLYTSHFFPVSSLNIPPSSYLFSTLPTLFPSPL
jgi:hypothetical protein